MVIKSSEKLFVTNDAATILRARSVISFKTQEMFW